MNTKYTSQLCVKQDLANITTQQNHCELLCLVFDGWLRPAMASSTMAWLRRLAASCKWLRLQWLSFKAWLRAGKQLQLQWRAAATMS